MDSLYRQPLSLILSAGCGLTAAWIGAIEARNAAMEEAACLLTAVAMWRVIMGWAVPRAKPGSARLLELLYAMGAFGYSAVCGLIAAEAVENPMAAGVRMMMVGNTITYGVAIAARNAGRPAIAIGQTVLALTPLVVACLLQADISYRFLALALVMVVPAVMLITYDIFHVLRASITAVETSERLADTMQQLACTDVVTGLLNRSGLNRDLVEWLDGLAADRQLALFWLDLDRFKEVNDTLGYQVGDRVLAEVGARLTARAPPDACIARFGGDEFIVACEMPDRTAAETLALGMLEEVTRPFRLDGVRVEIQSSVGIAMLPGDGSDVDTAMQSADIALAHCKLKGRKHFGFFDPAMTRNLVRKKQIETDLRIALQRDELSVHFQPMVDLTSGRIRGFEALVRWFHPEQGELTPDEFIPVAEDSGAIITLGNWITGHAARCAVGWSPEISLSVNLSPLQIRAPGGALGIIKALRDARLDPRRLVLEITETVLLESSATTEAFIAELVAVGVRFALDDFGTGYSSLSYLNRYPFSKIKVDRSFVSGANAGAKSDAIIRAVSGMAVQLGIEVVAEGVETHAQVEAVRAAGCSMGQGYYFGRAVSSEAALQLLLEERQGGAPGKLRA